MPNLDITELLSDPDFVSFESLALIRSTVVAGEDGYGVVTKTTTPFSGSVHPARARELLRVPEGSMTTGAIVVITQTALSPGNPGLGQVADQFTWKGDLYVVSSLDDYSEYGGGFVAAVGLLQSLQTAPPA